MNARSARAEVRNPVLALPAFRALQSLLPEQRVLLAALMPPRAPLSGSVTAITIVKSASSA